MNRLGTFLLVTMLWCFFIWPDSVTAVRMAGSGEVIYSVFILDANTPTPEGLYLGDDTARVRSFTALTGLKTARSGPTGRAKQC